MREIQLHHSGGAQRQIHQHDWGVKPRTKDREGIVADMKFTESPAFQCPTCHLQSYSLQKCGLMNILIEMSICMRYSRHGLVKSCLYLEEHVYSQKKQPKKKDVLYYVN